MLSITWLHLKLQKVFHLLISWLTNQTLFQLWIKAQTFQQIEVLLNNLV